MASEERMTYDQIQELITQIDESSLREFNLQFGGAQVSMSKNAAGVTAPQPAINPSHIEQGQSLAPVDLPHDATYIQSKERQMTEPDQAVQAKTDDKQSEGETIFESPLVGTVYLAPQPDAPNYVNEGDQVQAGDVLCIIETMKVMNEIKADAAGTVQEVLVTDGQNVEFSSPLFRIQER